MQRAILLITTTLALASPAVAAEKKRPAPQSEKAKEGSAKPADPKLKEAVAAARYLFRRRVDLCTPPHPCSEDSQQIIEDAEQKFVAACQACGDEKRCEEDRVSIRSGNTSASYNPCN